MADTTMAAHSAAAAPLQQHHTVHDTISLTPKEQEIFDTLLAAVRHAGAPTVLRCAGGWVRDKLLGRESLDIDIALDDMLGKDFATLVNNYLKSQVHPDLLARGCMLGSANTSMFSKMCVYCTDCAHIWAPTAGGRTYMGYRFVLPQCCCLPGWM
jgi:hypothetical protein